MTSEDETHTVAVGIGELRALNEELTTVNAQLRERIEQLERAHNELNNFLSRAVLDDLTPQAREISSEEGGRFVRRVLPYQTESRSEGVVIAYRNARATREAQTRESPQRLEKSEERLRVAAEAAGVGIFDRNLVTGEVSWSASLRDVLGLDPEATPPDLAEEAMLVHPEDRDQVVAMQRKVLDPKGDGKFESEHRIIRPDGKVRWLLSKGHVCFEGEGGERKPVRMSGMVFDITKRKNVEIAAMQSEARMRRLFEQAPAMIAIHEGPEHRYIYSNQLHDRVTGQRELMGKSLREAFADLSGQGIYERFDEVYKTGKAISIEAFPAAFAQEGRSEPTTGYFSQVLQPHYDEAGKVAGVMSFAYDVTDQVQLFEQSKANQEQLRQADQQKDPFLAMLGHELRNPLAAIRGASDMLKLTAMDHRHVVKAVSIVERQTTHMAKLLDAILDVSRLARGKISLEMEPIELTKLCREVIADRSAHLRTDHLEIVTQFSDQPIWVDGDGVRLSQVIDNLFSNACKFTDQGGKVEVTLQSVGPDAVLEIRDTGIGIDPEFLPHVFDLFRQVPQGLSRSPGGLGLGLSLVKSLVELHAGSVEAHSEGANQGAHFIVRIPRAERRSRKRPIGSQTKRKLSVLVIEDNHDVAQALGDLLEVCGHDVRVAKTGERGVELALKWAPDVVLCDLGLPDISGLEVANRLRLGNEGDARIPMLVAVTGHGPDWDRQRGRQAGFDTHLNKPVTLEGLDEVFARASTR